MQVGVVTMRRLFSVSTRSLPPMIRRRTALIVPLAVSLGPHLAFSQPQKDTLVLAMTLEPPGLDPTAGAASAIAEVVQYNLLETLTKIRSDASIAPLLAQSWTVSPDNKTWAFTLRSGVNFQNGEPFNAASVRFSFERAAAADSTNKDKAVFANIINLSATDDLTLVVTLKNSNPDFLFQLGQATAVIVEPKSAAGNNAQPVGTGPFKLESWAKGSQLVLTRWDAYRDVQSVALRRVTIRFISDAAAQVAALLAGDVDLFPRAAVARSLAQFKVDKRFQVLVGGSRAKTIVAINNKKKPLDDVRVRRAIACAIDRKQVVDAVADGFGTPIGSFYVPGAPGYVDLTAVQRPRPRQGPRAAQRSRHQRTAGAEPEIAAHALRQAGRRGDRGDVGQGGHRRQARKRRVGAVAVRRVRPEGLRPDHHQPCRAAGLRQLCPAWLLLELRVGPVQRLVGPDQQYRRHPAAAETAGRGPAPGGRRRGGRLPLPAHRDHGGQCAPEGRAGRHANLRQRPGGLELGLNRR
jgi:ABC-type transport system substrate-binding protein